MATAVDVTNRTWRDKGAAAPPASSPAERSAAGRGTAQPNLVVARVRPVLMVVQVGNSRLELRGGGGARRCLMSASGHHLKGPLGADIRPFPHGLTYAFGNVAGRDRAIANNVREEARPRPPPPRFARSPSPATRGRMPN
jgi:hypothetical protein